MRQALMAAGFAVMLIAIPATAWTDGFRSSSWGDTVEEVIRAENGTLTQVSPVRYFRPVQVSPMQGEAYFDFYDGRLYQGVYLFLQTVDRFSSQNTAPDEVVGGELSDDDFGVGQVVAYEAVPAILTSLYGPATGSTWVTETTEIRVIHTGGGNQIAMVIQYRAKDFGPESVDDFTANWINAITPLF